MSLTSVVALTAAAAAGTILPIALPYRPTGQYLIGNAHSTIQIEAFVDLFCGDARAEYFMWKGLKTDPTWNQSISEVGLRFHVLVEPFHPWSFTAAVGAQTAAAHSADAFFSFAEACWTNSGDFVQHWGDQHYPLANLAEVQVVAKLSQFAVAAGLTETAFYNGMTNRSTAGGTNPWAVAREAWKQAVARGAASSPWYFVNGVPYFAAGDAAHPGAQAWLSLIKQLVDKQ